MESMTEFSAGLSGTVWGWPSAFPLMVAMLLVTGRYSQRWFDFMHLYFWQVTMIAMVATAWLAWLWWVVRDETDPAAVS